MNPTDVLHKLSDLGITARASGEKLLLKPGSKVPAGLLVEIKEHKTELLDLLTQAPAACTCNPIPSQAEHGHLAQADCGPAYERCTTCGYRWRCKVCQGCRRCRFPG